MMQKYLETLPKASAASCLLPPSLVGSHLVERRTFLEEMRQQAAKPDGFTIAARLPPQ
jgi:hypothetical protein